MKDDDTTMPDFEEHAIIALQKTTMPLSITIADVVLSMKTLFEQGRALGKIEGEAKALKEFKKYSEQLKNTWLIRPRCTTCQSNKTFPHGAIGDPNHWYKCDACNTIFLTREKIEKRSNQYGFKGVF